MDSQIEKLLTDSVRRILEHADLNITNIQKVLLFAAEDSGLDSKLHEYENVAKNVIHKFFCKNAQVTPWLNMPIALKQKMQKYHRKLRHRFVVFAWMLFSSTVEIDQLQNLYAG